MKPASGYSFSAAVSSGGTRRAPDDDRHASQCGNSADLIENVEAAAAREIQINQEEIRNRGFATDSQEMVVSTAAIIENGQRAVEALVKQRIMEKKDVGLVIFYDHEAITHRYRSLLF